MPLALLGLFVVPRLLGLRSVQRPEFDSPASGDATVLTVVSDFKIGGMGWNRLRGPNGTGVFTSADGSSPPLEWSDTQNLKWQTRLPGKGSSSPILTDACVFLTAYDMQQSQGGEITSLTRKLVCIDRETGESLWTRAVAAELPEDPYVGRGLPEHGYATNTPVTDGNCVFAFFAKSGVFCFDLAGQQIWQTSVGRESNPKGWGSCSSLTLYGDLVIVNAAEESNAIVALHKETGQVAWRSTSPSLNYAFSTPALVRTETQAVELVFAMVGEVWGLNPATGKLLWYARSPHGGNVSPCVIVDGELVYVFGGYRDVGSMCIQAGGRGDVTDTHVRWTNKLTSYIVTPVLVGERFYWVDEKGRYFCQDAKTGELVAKARMPGGLSGQPIYASMISVNDRVLVQTRFEGVFVLEAVDELSVLQHNKLADESMANATPAVGAGQLFLRSDDFLACIESSDE